MIVGDEDWKEKKRNVNHVLMIIAMINDNNLSTSSRRSPIPS